MPTIAHAIFGGAVALVLMSWSKNSSRVFTPHLVILFTLNSFIGPDLFNIVLMYGRTSIIETIHAFVHSLVGFWIVTPGLAVVYYLIMNAKRKGAEKIPYLPMVITIGAAGILHFALDILDYGIRVFPLVDYYWDIETFQTGSTNSVGPLSGIFPFFSTTELFLVGLGWMCVLIYVLLKKSEKQVFLVATIFLGTIIGLLLLFGNQIVRGEHDLGYLAYALIFWVLPLALCYIAGIPQDHPCLMNNKNSGFE